MRHAAVHDPPTWGTKAILAALLKLGAVVIFLIALLAFPALSQQIAPHTLELNTFGRYIDFAPATSLQSGVGGGLRLRYFAHPRWELGDTLRRHSDRAVRTQQLAEARVSGLRPIEVRDRMSTTIYFDVGSSVIRPDAIAALDSKLDLLRGIPTLQIRIEGQADVRGSTAGNITLAWARAEAAKRWLTSRGIPSDRIDAVGFSASRPICEDRNESCLWQNRRAEFVIVAGADAGLPRTP